MANDIVRFANSVEYVTGKKRGRKPVFSASQFYPYKEERVLQGATRNELMRFIEVAYEKATVGVAIMDDISELYDLELDFPEDFKKQVVSSANAIARNATDNFANQSEMIIGKPYYPSEVKPEILTSWESNFLMQCRSAEDDVKKDMARIIQQAKDEGWNKKQLEKAVKSELPDKYKYRAELIARTETAKLNSRVNRETYKEIGIQYYTWMTTLDGRERSSHANMNNLICAVDNPNVYYEETENGLVEHERSSDMVHLHPGEDFQCRCSMVMWDPMLQGKYAVKEEPEQEPEEKPKTTAEILKETQEQLELARNQLEGANRKNEILQIAQARHAARTEAVRNRIMKGLNERLDIRKLTHEAVKEAEGINGIGLEELKETMKGGSKKQYTKMQKQANEIRAKVEELRNMKYVQNPLKVAKDFDYQTAVTVEKSVGEKLRSWGYNSMSLEERKRKLEFEIRWVEEHKKYSSWKVAQDAYKKLLSEAEKEYKLEPMSSSLTGLKEYASTHKRFLNFKKWVQELESMLANKAEYSEKEFETLYEKILKERARIMTFDPKPKVVSLDILQGTLGKKMPKTLQNLDKEINGKLNTPSYSKFTEAQRIEYASKMLELFKNSDFGMNVPRTNRSGIYILDSLFESYFKNQIETKTGKGWVNVEGRKQASKDLFGTDLKKAKGDDFEKYGFLMSKDMVKQSKSGIANQYWNGGDGIQVRFKKDKVIATFTTNDSLESELAPSLVTDPKITSSKRYDVSDAIGITPTDAIKATREIGNSYIELQYHGHLGLDCIESIFIPKDVLPNINADTITKMRATGATLFTEKNGKAVAI